MGPRTTCSPTPAPPASADADQFKIGERLGHKRVRLFQCSGRVLRERLAGLGTSGPRRTWEACVRTGLGWRLHAARSGLGAWTLFGYLAGRSAYSHLHRRRLDHYRHHQQRHLSSSSSSMIIITGAAIARITVNTNNITTNTTSTTTSSSPHHSIEDSQQRCSPVPYYRRGRPWPG